MFLSYSQHRRVNLPMTQLGSIGIESVYTSFYRSELRVRYCTILETKNLTIYTEWETTKRLFVIIYCINSVTCGLKLIKFTIEKW